MGLFSYIFSTNLENKIASNKRYCKRYRDGNMDKFWKVKKGRSLKENMKNMFLLKNIRKPLNKTESEHENIA